MKNSFYINYISGSIIIISFFIGLLVNENSSGGAENDSIAILNNVELFNSYNLNEICRIDIFDNVWESETLLVHV